jgi:hypothetical protein
MRCCLVSISGKIRAIIFVASKVDTLPARDWTVVEYSKIGRFEGGHRVFQKGGELILRAPVTAFFDTSFISEAPLESVKFFLDQVEANFITVAVLYQFAFK